MSINSEQEPKSNEINYYEDVMDWQNILDKLKAKDIDEAINICDLSKVIEMHKLWRRQLPRVKPYYALKCNNDAFIVKLLATLGVNFDCASKTEIEQILGADVSPERIIFANPCRPLTHINYAKANNVTKVTVDSEFELYKMYKNFPQAEIVLRIRSDASDAQCLFGEKFGCDTTNDAGSLMLLAKSLNLNVIGVSFHVGSGCRESSAYDRAIKSAANIFKFGALLGYNMNLLDIGGGFPGNDDDVFVKISDTIEKALSKYFPDENVQIIAEPGRFFVASAYTLICKIHAKREVRNHEGKVETRMYYVNDGVYGFFNFLLYEPHPIDIKHLKKGSDLKTFKSTLWGPTCDGLDKLAENTALPNLTYGDYVAFPDMGAYTAPVASPFNGFLLPKTFYFMKRELQLTL